MTKETLRMRVFAGPNGSGKSTIINSVRNIKVNGLPVDFGIYINADEIAEELRKDSCSCSFSKYKVTINRDEFEEIALNSGLIGENFNEIQFKKSFTIENNTIKTITKNTEERLAQIIADVLRKKLLSEKKKFSFETVFSHKGKVDFMKQAKEAGYKVYLYFISTESPEINIYRVKEVRVKMKGHDVPEDKIRSRYYRSMKFLYEASQYTYQSFYFDNSRDGEGYNLFAHFKLNKDGAKVWDDINQSEIPIWFKEHYSE